jgi:cytochrome c oxidase cbb3-type subunit 4
MPLAQTLGEVGEIMSYDTVATISQITSLLMFVGMFMAVLAYALWPRNGPRFEEAQRRALDLDQRPNREGGRQ